MVTRVDAIELQINKNEEIWFEPWDTSLPEANHFIFNKIGALTAQIHAHTGDSWRMTFSVHAENANEINFIMSVAAANDKMVATLAR